MTKTIPLGGWGEEVESADIRSEQILLATEDLRLDLCLPVIKCLCLLISQ